MIGARTALAALAVLAAPAHAAVTISTAATQNMSCTAGTCEPTATQAVLNATDLENDLSQYGNVTVMTTGNGVEANNIVVKAAFSSFKSTSLTLNAHGAITVNAAVSIGSDSAELELVSGKGGKLGTLSFGRKGSITFGSLSDIFGINGGIFTLVGSVQGLASAVAANPSGAFALANGYDASQDGTYSASPVTTPLAGLFEGLGNSISNLSVSSGTSVVGLFANTDASATISSLRLVKASVTDTNANTTVGGLVGNNDGLLFDDSVNGVIGGSDATSANSSDVGALTGSNSGTISDCETSGEVDAAYFTAIGGLVGTNTGTIRNAHTRSRVKGGTYVGGLAAFNSAMVIDSYATGRVTGKLGHGVSGDDNTFVGGLVGSNYGLVKRSHASGTVISEATKQGYALVGGLIGYNVGCCSHRDGVVETSYATGGVSAKGFVVEAGGLIGVTFGESNYGHYYYGKIGNDYSTGAVIGTSGTPSQVYVGGLVGYDIAGSELVSTPISTSYSTGAVSGVSGANVGGFIGGYGTTIDNSYWDTTTSGTTQGTGNDGNVSGLTGLTSKQLQSGLPTGFDPKVWAENPNINNGLPYLIDNPPPK